MSVIDTSNGPAQAKPPERESLARSPESLTLNKLLASQISLTRCGYAVILGLKEAA